VHEWLWRGGYQPIADRSEEVRKFYEGESDAVLAKYRVEYVIVGGLEREKYKKMDEERIGRMAVMVYDGPGTRIYKVN
jgi:uncharacterized membrane protein